MIDLQHLIKMWEEFGDNHRNNTFYMSDTDFKNYFSIKCHTEYISTVFEILEGEYGLGRNVEYYNFKIPKTPLLLNYETLEMSLLDNENCSYTSLLEKYNLTIFNDSFLITTSEYLKPICLLLFSSYKTIEGISYVCNNLINIVSYVLPNYIVLNTKLECNVLSLPFSLSFMNQLNIDYEVNYYFSQIEGKKYNVKKKII